MKDVSKFIASIMSMSIKDRTSIAQLILASLDESPEDGVEAEWIATAESRLNGLESGEVKTVSWESIRSRLGK